MPPKDPKSQNVEVAQLKRPKASQSRETSADNATAGPSKPSFTLMPRLPSPLKSTDDVFKTPDQPIPIVDFRDPSPKRVQTEASPENFEKSNANPRKSSRHNRSSSLIGINENTNTKGEGKSPSSGPSPRVKPPSLISKAPQNANHSETPFSETNNDSISVADSIANADPSSPSGIRIKRTEGERKQYFENQPECDGVEAHRAFCTRCKEWIRLSAKQTYSVRPWEVHRTKCDQKVPTEKTYKNLGLVAAIPFSVPRTEKNRRVLLELDDAAETVEPNQVKCKTCNNWIPLEKKYSVRCWAKHVAGCQQDLKPGDVEKKLERKLFFLCDLKQFKGFRDAHTVECATCGSNVSLNSEVEYDLEKWLKHKETCDPSTSQPYITPKPESKLSEGSPESKPSAPTVTDNAPEPDTLVRATTAPLPEPPKSKSESASPELNRLAISESERTLVESASLATIPAVEAQRPPSPTPLPSLKRKRDEDTSMDVDEQNDEEERPSIRPRTEDYIPDDRDSPSGLGWFLLPFKAFVKGFRESLTTIDD